MSEQVLQINEKLRLRRLDPHNVVIEQGHMTDPKRHTSGRGETQPAHMEWLNLGYYGDWPAALDALPRRALTGDAGKLAEQIAGLRADIQSLKDRIVSSTIAGGLPTPKL